MHLHHVSENRILDALPGDVRGRLLPQMVRIVMPLGMTIHETGHELRHIFFPIDSIVSVVCVMRDGAATECAMVGNEGAIGLPLFMGGETTTNRAVVQSAGAAYRLTRQHLKDELRRDDTLLTLLLRYAQSLLVQTIQTAVCNRHHTLDQQLCRWLLLALDRHLSSNTLDVTQEFVAHMLGVRREGVTIAAGKLKDMGVIRYNRGRITVLDRPTLESLSCECYTAVKAESDRLSRLPAQRPSRRMPVEAVVTVRQRLTGSAPSLERTLRPVDNAFSNGRGVVA